MEFRVESFVADADGATVRVGAEPEPEEQEELVVREYAREVVSLEAYRVLQEDLYISTSATSSGHASCG